MANITFTIPSVLNLVVVRKELTEVSANSLQDAFAKISEQLWVMILSVEF